MRRVPEPADMQPLEQDRAFFGESVLAVLECFLHLNRSGLAHGDGGVGRILRQPERVFDPTRLRLADENRDAVNFRIVVGFDDDFMVRSDELELRVDGAQNVPILARVMPVHQQPKHHGCWRRD